MDKDVFKLLELAELVSVPARTIRLYIARGLMPGPLRSGRDAAYGREHLERLRQIRALQEQGLTLEEIRLLLHGGPPAAADLPVRVWRHVEVARDVVVMVDESVSGWRARRIRHALEVLRQHLEEQPSGDMQDEHQHE